MLLMMLLLLSVLAFVPVSVILAVITLFQGKYKLAFLWLLAAIAVVLGLFLIIWADMKATDQIIKDNPETWTEKVW